MFKFVVLVACVFASAQAGVLHAAGSFATGPALGAPLLGSVTYNAPETTIVKQPVVVDQPEIRYRSVPTIVQTAPIVKTVQPVIQAAPAVRVAAAPIAYSAVQHVAAAPVAYSAVQHVAAAPLAYSAVAAPGLTYAAAPFNNFAYGYTAPLWK